MDRTFAKKQILRMGQMYRFPIQAETMGELVDALMVKEANELLGEDGEKEMATGIVSGFLADATGDTPCPMSSQIRSAVMDRLRAKFGDSRPDPECPKCNGVGFPLSERGAGPKCSCWARRHAPNWRKLKGSEPIGPEINEQLKQLVASKTGGSK